MHDVQIECPRCKNRFRDSATRLQSGYSRQCPSCEIVLFFDEDSQNPMVKLTMRRAREVRKRLREAEAAFISANHAPAEEMTDDGSTGEHMTEDRSPETFSRGFSGRSRSRTRTR